MELMRLARSNSVIKNTAAIANARLRISSSAMILSVSQLLYSAAIEAAKPVEYREPYFAIQWITIQKRIIKSMTLEKSLF